MIKRAEDLHTEVFTNRFGGKGEIHAKQLLAKEHFLGKGRLFSHHKIKPGSSLGQHQHNGDFEVFYILHGEGIVDDNGSKSKIKAGDVVLTGNGESHALENTGSVDLEYIALVLYA
ncbi:MAG TPA: cupin domain-containing protein [Nitrospirota bacterium]|nr:cupin domain-containing protein [Nitrospirota bacterium]